MKKIITTLAIVFSTMNICAQAPYAGGYDITKNEQVAANRKSWKSLEKDLNFYMANDLGRNGYFDQKPIAELMGEMAGDVDPECVLAAGDVHHFEGVKSVNDPLWMTNYEMIYSHPDLMIDWFPILGNHEYRGNTQATIDYSNISRRWIMPERFYTKSYESNGTSIRFVMIDTSPLIDKYREDKETYPDATKQDMNKQLAWIDSVLTAAKEKWIVVIGHHPIFAETTKSENERTDLQKRLDPILRKHKVDMYACGHIHNFQHIRKNNCNIEYVVNSSASLCRKVKPIDGTLFCSSEAGFSVISATNNELFFNMIDKNGKIIYTITHKK